MRHPRRPDRPDPTKDRSRTLDVVYDEIQIRYESSSALPTTYALILQVKRNDAWIAVFSVDNSHERSNVDKHHMHRYVGGRKGKAEPLPIAVQNASDLHKVIKWMSDNWVELAA